MSNATTPAGTFDLDDELPAVFHDALGLEEISLVPRGANPRADVLTFKGDADDASSHDASAEGGVLGRVRRVIHTLGIKMSALVAKYDLPADEVAPVMAGIESASILATLADVPAGESSPAPHAAADDPAAPAVAEPAAVPAPGDTPSQEESSRMSANATEPNTQPAASDERVKKMDEALQEAVLKAEQLEAANAVLSERFEKMAADLAERSLTEQVAKLFDGVPGDTADFRAIVLKCDDAASRAALEKLVKMTRAALTEAKVMKSAGVSGSAAEFAGDTERPAAAAFQAAVTTIQRTENLSLNQATLKAMEVHKDLAAAMHAEHRQLISRSR